MTTATVHPDREHMRDLLEHLRIARERLRKGLDLSKRLMGALLAGLAANVQKAREMITKWVADELIVRWQNDPEIMGHRRKFLGLPEPAG